MIDVDSDPLAKAVLIAIADACDYSLHKHVPEGLILKKFQTHLRGDVKNIIKKLCRTPYIHKHPTRGNMTYNITRDGLLKAQQ